jgi:small subunit ribosomal protein S1
MTANNPSQSFSANEFLEALEQHNYEFSVGQIISGKIISHARDGVYVDVGGKSPAFLPAEEAMLENNTDLVTSLPLDSEHEFLIISEQNADGEVKLSIRRMLIKKAWQTDANLSGRRNYL